MLSTIQWTVVLAMSTAALAAVPSRNSPTAPRDLSTDMDNANQAFYNYLFIICASLVAVMTAWRVMSESVKYVRTLTCLNNSTQRYFSKPSESFATFKAKLLYAPVFRKRHNREFQLSTAVNIGTLPTRLQLLFLVAYFGTNITFCVTSIYWNQDFATVSEQVRNRAGVLAVVNMVPLFIMSGRNNPLINWLNISYDTFNLLHRWFGRIVILEIMAHTGAWVASHAHQSGWSSVMTSVRTSQMLTFGFIVSLRNSSKPSPGLNNSFHTTLSKRIQATVTAAIISIQSMSILRHAFYETFKYMHIALIILSVVTIWYHLHLSQIPEVKILYAVVAIWGAERSLRIVKLLYRNIGNGGSKALIECLPGNAVRVTVNLARPWSFKPGQHAYLYMPAMGLWTSHPFSVAWSEEAENLSEKKGLVSNQQDILALRKTKMSFIIRARTGFTNTLFKRAGAAPDGRMYTSCFAEGPYGGLHVMHSYGTVMLFAGGIGISHQVPYVRDLVAGFANGTVATRKVILVWVIQNPEHLEWIRPWMTEILTMEKRRDVLRIMLFVSRPRSTKEIHSPSATVQMFPGRPNVETLLDMEIENQIGAMGVSVCASGSFSDDVRRAVRNRQHTSNIDFVEEAFSW
jgi:predicted ferric reductase